jgi:hypothetical protein
MAADYPSNQRFKPNGVSTAILRNTLVFQPISPYLCGPFATNSGGRRAIFIIPKTTSL